MNKNQLRKLSDLPHLAEYSIEEIITEMGLYSTVLIDVAPVQAKFNVDAEAESPDLLSVSNDLGRLHELLEAKGPYMLPCFQCRTFQPYEGMKFYNPRVSSGPKVTKSNVMPVGSHHHNVFTDPQPRKIGDEMAFPPGEPYYNVGQEILVKFDHRYFREDEEKKFRESAWRTCINRLPYLLPEFRKDFVCAYDINHRIFVDFVIYPAVTDKDKPDELLEYCDKYQEIASNTCSSNETSNLYNLFQQLSSCLILKKVAMYPSQADLQLFDTEKYRKILGRNYREYTTALGLYACGIGSGSFVYLRRIFAFLAEESHQNCISKENWNEEEFKEKRFNEKLEYMEQFGEKLIPDELTPVKAKLYGVLSKGIHIASDKECRELFPYMQFAIEMILDAKLAKKDREEKIKKHLAKIQSVKV